MADEKTKNKPVCFVISPIGIDVSETRKRSDRVLKHIIKATLEPAYKVVRAGCPTLTLFWLGWGGSHHS